MLTVMAAMRLRESKIGRLEVAEQRRLQVATTGQLFRHLRNIHPGGVSMLRLVKVATQACCATRAVATSVSQVEKRKEGAGPPGSRRELRHPARALTSNAAKSSVNGVGGGVFRSSTGSSAGVDGLESDPGSPPGLGGKWSGAVGGRSVAFGVAGGVAVIRGSTRPSVPAARDCRARRPR